MFLATKLKKTADYFKELLDNSSILMENDMKIYAYFLVNLA